MPNLRGQSLDNHLIIAAVYDNAKNTNPKTNKVTYFPEFSMHPDDPASVGQQVPDLRLQKTGTSKGDNGQVRNHYHRSVPWHEGQIEDLIAIAGDAKYPLTNAKGEKIGMNYVVLADLIPVRNDPYPLKEFGSDEKIKASSYLTVKPKSIRTVDPKYAMEINGKSPTERQFDLAQAARAEAKASPVVEAAKEVEAFAGFPVAGETLEEAVEVEVDEPELG